MDFIASLGLVESFGPDHESCFHRRSRDLTPVAWTVALPVRTHGGRTWRTIRRWDTIADGSVDRKLSANGHSESALMIAAGELDHIDHDGRWIVGTGYGYLRPDGIAVIPVGALAP